MNQEDCVLVLIKLHVKSCQFKIENKKSFIIYYKYPQWKCSSTMKTYENVFYLLNFQMEQTVKGSKLLLKMVN